MPSDKKKLSPSSATNASPRVTSVPITSAMPSAGDVSGGAASPRGALAPPYNSFANASTTTKALTPNQQLGELLRGIDPKCCFHPAVEELLLEMANDFVDDVVGFSSRLAKHRRSTVLEPRDLQFCLAKNYGLALAGVLPSSASAKTSSPALNPLGQDLLVRARPSKNSLHMHRMALKRKSLQLLKTKLKGAHAAKVSDNSGRKVVRKGSLGK